VFLKLTINNIITWL